MNTTERFVTCKDRKGIPAKYALEYAPFKKQLIVFRDHGEERTGEEVGENDEHGIGVGVGFEESAVDIVRVAKLAGIDAFPCAFLFEHDGAAYRIRWHMVEKT